MASGRRETPASEVAERFPVRTNNFILILRATKWAVWRAKGGLTVIIDPKPFPKCHPQVWRGNTAQGLCISAYVPPNSHYIQSD